MRRTMRCFVLFLGLGGFAAEAFSTHNRRPNEKFIRQRPNIRPTTSVDALPDVVSSMDSILSEGSELLGVPSSTVLAATGIAGAGALALKVLGQNGPLASPQLLSSIVEGTFLQGKELECVYRATRDGWSAVDFHEAVDSRGSAVIVARTGLTGRIFGGYNPAGWRSTDDYVTSSAAFLWYPKGAAGAVVKCPVLPLSPAVFDYATSGPNFGAVDLQIGPPQAQVMGGFAGPDMEDTAANAGDLRQCRSNSGIAYDVDGGWPVRGRCAVVQVEAYCRK